MIKHPVITSLLIAGVVALGYAWYMLAATRNVDEKPFILYFTLILFPFGWFFLWIILNAVAWWQGLTGGTASSDHADRKAKR